MHSQKRQQKESAQKRGWRARGTDLLLEHDIVILRTGLRAASHAWRVARTGGCKPARLRPRFRVGRRSRRSLLLCARVMHL